MKTFKIFALTVFFTISLNSNSQDSLKLHDTFYKNQQQSLLLLSGWSVVNLIGSPIANKNMYNSTTTNEYFHEMNFNWNLLNAGIAGLSHFLVHRDSKREWNLNQLSTKKTKAEKSIIFNMGLDLVYVISGLIMNKNSDVNKESDNINIGYGNSLMVQGGYLFLYDAIFLRKLKKIKMQPKFD